MSCVYYWLIITGHIKGKCILYLLRQFEQFYDSHNVSDSLFVGKSPSMSKSSEDFSGHSGYTPPR